MNSLGFFDRYGNETRRFTRIKGSIYVGPQLAFLLNGDYLLLRNDKQYWISPNGTEKGKLQLSPATDYLTSDCEGFVYVWNVTEDGEKDILKFKFDPEKEDFTKVETLRTGCEHMREFLVGEDGRMIAVCTSGQRRLTVFGPDGTVEDALPELAALTGWNFILDVQGHHLAVSSSDSPFLGVYYIPSA